MNKYCINKGNKIIVSNLNIAEAVTVKGSWRSRGAALGFGGRGRGGAYVGRQDAASQSFRTRNVVREFDCSEDIDAPLLTSRIKMCEDFPKLREFFGAQKDKPYFNFIHASAFFGRLVEVIMRSGVDALEYNMLSDFKNSVCLFVGDFNARTFSNVANDGLKLLEYAERKELKEIEVLATDVLCSVFEGVSAKKDLHEFQPQGISNLAHTGYRFFKYGLNRELKEIEELALVVLGCIFKEVSIRGDLRSFTPQGLATLMNCGSAIFKYAQERVLVEVEELTLCLLLTLCHEIDSRKNLLEFNLQDLSIIANSGSLIYICEKKSDHFNVKNLIVLSKVLEKIAKTVCALNFAELDLVKCCYLAWNLSVGPQTDIIYDWLQRGLNDLDKQEIEQFVTNRAGLYQVFQVFLKKALSDGVWNNDAPDAFLEYYLSKDFSDKILEVLSE